jgi:hypothetical protein
MPRRVRALLLTLVVTFVLLALALALFTPGQRPTRPPLPNPNGYDDFLRAGAAVTDDVGNFSTLDRDGLRELVRTNTEPLRLLRLGMTRQCAMPIDWSATNFMGMVGNLAEMKKLALLLAAEGRLAEMDSLPADAAKSYVDAIHFGNEVGRGGFLINRLVGVACEAIGSRSVSKLVPGLTCQQARPLIAELEKIDGARVTWDEIWRTESAYARSQLSKIGNPLGRFTAWWQLRPVRKNAEARHTMAVAHVRLLAVELALHCYQAENSRLPAHLDELVPKYLSKVPQDPFTGQPLIYRAQGTNWLLYSVGTDRVDDGGRPVSRGIFSKGDLFFDSPW